MMISRFFSPDPLPPAGEVRLSDPAAHHATKVLRLREGAPLGVFDGQGGEARALLVRRGKDWFAILGDRLEPKPESPLRVVLVQALAGGDKMDWIVQKAVELGVAGIVPVRAERSIVRLPPERASRRLEHWRQVAVSACEQCGRNRVPEIAAIRDLDDYLDETRQGCERLVLVPEDGTALAGLQRPGGAVHLLIGPEGGWSERERAAFDAAGCVRIRLGPRVLRTETAGLAALSAAQVLWGDF